MYARLNTQKIDTPFKNGFIVIIVIFIAASYVKINAIKITKSMKNANQISFVIAGPKINYVWLLDDKTIKN